MTQIKKPIIGITLDYSELKTYAHHPWFALRTCYSDSLEAVGAVPIFLSFNENLIDDYLDLIDGLLIPGADVDIDPAKYGQQALTDTLKIVEKKTAFEFALTKKALERNMPFFGICNGEQILNVCFGGDIIQDIPSFIKTNINHEQPHPKNIATHDLNIKENSLLSKIANNYSNFRVNSTHHQAVGKVGNGLEAVAHASDDIIEAIELKNHDFAIGVEWHPEYHGTECIDNPDFKLDTALFRAFTEAAIKYKIKND